MSPTTPPSSISKPFTGCFAAATGRPTGTWTPSAEYGWFASDIATALYAALWRVHDPAERAVFPGRFLRHFLRGYREHFDLPAEEWALLPDFLRLRDVLIYTVGRKQLDPARLTDKQLSLFALRRSRIETQTPVVAIDAEQRSP